MDLELHQLDLRYEKLRRRAPEREKRLLGSLAQHGQQAPIVVVRGEDDRSVVVDGYKRVRALKTLKADTVQATGWALPVLLAQARPNKANTTTYRSAAQAERDLREILNANKADIAALPPDAASTVGGTFSLPQARQGFNSAFGGPAQALTFNEVTWRVSRLTNGELHLVHFSPHF